MRECFDLALKVKRDACQLSLIQVRMKGIVEAATNGYETHSYWLT